jgi:hemolysin activation/secretion protein
MTSNARPKLLWTLLTAVAVAAQGAQAAAPPNSGELLQQVPPPAPPPQAAPPVVTVSQPEAGVATPGATFLVQHIEITGASVLPARVLRAIVSPSEGQMLSLADLQRLADKITAQYHKSGYPFSQAYVPVQAVHEGRVSIAVLEARYDRIVLHNSSRVRDFVPQASLSALKVDMPVEQASLDRVLLLISDLPATEVKGTLRPGQSAGTSELQVDVSPAPLFNGSVSADDYGNAATGRERLNASANLLEPLRLGDVLSASALSAGRGMNYGRLGYEVPLYGPATQIEAHVSTLGYELVNGSESGLEAHGTASVFGVGVSQSLLRSLAANVTARVTFEDTPLDDRVDVSGIRTERHTEAWRALVGGGVNDATGASNFSAGLTVGRVVYDDSAARTADAAGAQTEGRYVKFLLSLSRLQQIMDKTSLYAALSYQGADKNLDSSEQFFVGGPSSVEAYDNGVLSGAQGNAQTLELRRDLPTGNRGQWQGRLFLEHAQVQIEKNHFGSGPNGANLSAAGVGVNWIGPKAWSLTSSLGAPVGGTPESIGHRPSVRFWMQVQKGF